MERGSDAHSPRVDEQMRRESESFTRGEPIEARAEAFRQMEEADDEILSGALRQEAVRERSELARHLRGSIFPADAAAVVACALEEHAPDDLVARLRELPDDQVFVNVEGVWEALGGEREQRTHDEPAPDERRTFPVADLEASSERADREPVPPRSDAASGAPPRASARATEAFGFRFDLVHRLAGVPFLVSPASASVVVDHARRRLVARFGPWRVETSLDNVVSATFTGPYRAVKTIGPPHLSLVDRGLTFATNDRRGLCIRFRSPVGGIDPLGLVRHPALTVTVDDVAALQAALVGRSPNAEPRTPKPEPPIR